MSPRYVRIGGYPNTDPYTPDEPEPTDEELGWGEVPVDIYGNTEEEPE